MQRVVVFLDYANINRAASDSGRQLNYKDLLSYLGEGRFLVEAHCYVPIDPRVPQGRDCIIEDLWTDGYLVHTKIGTQHGDTYKCNFDVEMTMDMMATATDLRPDIVVLASGDGDFVPVVLELRRRGIRVEVLAFVENAAREMILKCSGFIDLDVYLIDRAANSDAPSEDGESSAAGMTEPSGLEN